MARPIVSDAAEDLYASLGPYTVGDEDQDWHLLLACEAICQAFVEPVAELVSERDGRVPWQILFDPSECPAYALPFLAQFTGSTLTDSMTEAEMRAAIALPEGWLRGTPGAMMQAIQRTLTGSKHVAFIERYTGSAYQLAVRTQISETPDATVTEAAIVAVKPIGIVLDYADISGNTYTEVAAAYTDYDDVEASVSDYSDLLLI